jgi:hypothetical protein
MKEEQCTLVYLAAATLLLRGLYLLARTPEAYNHLRSLLKAATGPVLMTDLALPVRNRKTPVS